MRYGTVWHCMNQSKYTFHPVKQQHQVYCRLPGESYPAHLDKAVVTTQLQPDSSHWLYEQLATGPLIITAQPCTLLPMSCDMDAPQSAAFPLI
jgi:hypothetical protein